MGWENIMNWDFAFILSSLIQAIANKISHPLCFTVLCAFMSTKDKALIAARETLPPTPSNVNLTI